MIGTTEVVSPSLAGLIAWAGCSGEVLPRLEAEKFSGEVERSALLVAVEKFFQGCSGEVLPIQKGEREKLEGHEHAIH